jgi:L-aminopeptidase/D-esterase-like protein
VAALIAVNAVGDVIDPATGDVVAGVRSEDGRGFADARKLLRSPGPPGGRPGENTTIGVVATNARLTKAQATKVAQMAHDGLARAIYPAHTPADGDTLFALALGSFEGDANLALLGALAADATAEAILSAVKSAESAGGYRAVRDLTGPR